jgi:hypothetical protein
MADYYAQEGNQQVPVFNRATPGFAGAIIDAVRALSQTFAPRSIAQRKQGVDQAVAQGAGEHPQTSDLGNQF